MSVPPVFGNMATWDSFSFWVREIEQQFMVTREWRGSEGVGTLSGDLSEWVPT